MVVATHELPAPLAPPDLDLAGLGGFMLDLQRLFASELWALSSGDEFKAAVALWGRAWQQRPAGSLPNDEKVLAAFSGAGNAWKKVREMALRGFVECSDGRLYHKVLCEDALNAHRKRLAFRDRTKAATDARRQRNDQRNDDGEKERNDGRNGQRDEAEKEDVTSVQSSVFSSQDKNSPSDKSSGECARAAARPPDGFRDDERNVDDPLGGKSSACDLAADVGHIDRPTRGRARRQETAWPVGLAFGETERAFASDRGIVGPSAERLWEAFEANAKAKALRYADWRQAWRTWVLKQLEFDAKSRRPAYANGSRPRGRPPDV